MSNRTFIHQQTVIVRHSKAISKEIIVFDDYETGTIDLIDIEFNDFIDDDLELLSIVVQTAKLPGFQAIAAILDHIQETEKGIFIEGIWYDWEEIKHVFRNNNE